MVTHCGLCRLKRLSGDPSIWQYLFCSFKIIRRDKWSAWFLWLLLLSLFHAEKSIHSAPAPVHGLTQCIVRHRASESTTASSVLPSTDHSMRNPSQGSQRDADSRGKLWCARSSHCTLNCVTHLFSRAWITPLNTTSSEKYVCLVSPFSFFQRWWFFWPSELSTGKAAFFLGYPWSREQGDLWIDCKPNPVEYQDCCQMLRLIACWIRLNPVWQLSEVCICESYLRSKGLVVEDDPLLMLTATVAWWLRCAQAVSISAWGEADFLHCTLIQPVAWVISEYQHYYWAGGF